MFFDITVEDVDPRAGRDYAGQPDGASILLPDNGPAHMESQAGTCFRGDPVIFDKDAPNFGLIPPPESAPYIGHFLIEIPLGGDLNGNGEPDKIKFTLVTHSVGGENRTFIELPDGTVIDEFDSAAFLEGAVVDESTDPPFTIGAQLPSGLPDPAAFGGPTTASSTLLNEVVDDCGGCRQKEGTLEFETELVELNLTGGPFPMPLASDPDSLLDDTVEGFGFVDSEVSVTLSSQRAVDPGPRSLGEACALDEIHHPLIPPVDPDQHDGCLFVIGSFFDVFFDITVTDVDNRPGRDYAGQPDGASILLPDNGPACMQSLYPEIFDIDAPNFGLIPPPKRRPTSGIS